MEELHISTGSSSMKNKLMIFLFLLFFFLLLARVGAQADDRNRDYECLPMRCGAKGPEIRFPFWLKDRQPERCGYGLGFALTCNPTNNIETLVYDPFSVRVAVTEINYYCQLIRYEFSGNYDLHQQNLSLILNTSPFSPFQLWLHTVYEYKVIHCHSDVGKNYKYSYGSSYDSTCEYPIFSCPSSVADSFIRYHNKYAPLPWLGRSGHNLYLLNSDYLITRTLLNCSKIHTLSLPCFYASRAVFNPDGLWAGQTGPNQVVRNVKKRARIAD